MPRELSLRWQLCPSVVSLGMKLSICSVIGVLLLGLWSCSSAPDAQVIIDKAIAAHGGASFEAVHIEFDFRDRHYTYHRLGGLYTYTREFSDSTGQVKDILNNEGFVRLVNGDTATLSEERRRAFTNSVNSVLYFAVLPYGLNDAAVRKEYVKETTIKGVPYHLIGIRFAQEGGGEDFEDQFFYWINAETYTMDYLAYSYQTEGGGLRFREAINPREMAGIRFQDYLNYKPQAKNIPLDSLQPLYESGKLELLSEIQLQNLEVVVNP